MTRESVFRWDQVKVIRIVSGFFANAALLALHERLEPIHALVQPAMLKQTSALVSGKQARGVSYACDLCVYNSSDLWVCIKHASWEAVFYIRGRPYVVCVSDTPDVTWWNRQRGKYQTCPKKDCVEALLQQWSHYSPQPRPVAQQRRKRCSKYCPRAAQQGRKRGSTQHQQIALPKARCSCQRDSQIGGWIAQNSQSTSAAPRGRIGSSHEEALVPDNVLDWEVRIQTEAEAEAVGRSRPRINNRNRPGRPQPLLSSWIDLHKCTSNSPFFICFSS